MNKPHFNRCDFPLASAPGGCLTVPKPSAMISPLFTSALLPALLRDAWRESKQSCSVGCDKRLSLEIFSRCVGNRHTQGAYLSEDIAIQTPTSNDVVQLNVQRERRSLQVLVSAAASAYQALVEENFENCKPPPQPLENVTSSHNTLLQGQATTRPPGPHDSCSSPRRCLMVRFGDFVVQMQPAC